MFNSKTECIISPIGGSIDAATQEVGEDFANYLRKSSGSFYKLHKRKNPIFKLWHLNGSLESFSNDQFLLSFYELDSPTEFELNIVNNNKKVYFSSEYTCDIFKKYNCSNVEYLPLAFDEYNFYNTDREYFTDRITFNIVGKLEKRKHHEKLIKAWVKKYGNNKKYQLQCSIYNNFLSAEAQSELIKSWLDNNYYYNVSFLNFMNTNKAYNDYLNSGDIVIAMSGGEGWGLPEFHSLCLGKHGVVLNAHGYKSWANEKNCVLVEPLKNKIDAYDNIFFKKGQTFNQGMIFDFEEEAFIEGCEKAIKRFESNRINEYGVSLKEKFSSKKLVNKILNDLK